MKLNKEIRLSSRKTEKSSRRTSGKKRSRFGGKTSTGELVGVKLGATQIAAARVANGASGPKLLQVERQTLPSGIVVSGEVTDVAALSAGLDEFFRTTKLPRKGVRIGLATNHVGVRIFDLAGIDDEAQLANAVLFRAHEVVSIPVDEAVIDYRVIHEETDADGVTNRRILLVAAYREPIERFMTAFRDAGIELVGVDLEAFALLRAVSAPTVDGPTGAAVVSLNVGHERTILAVSDGSVCQFTRVIAWGGSKLAGAIERGVNVPSQEAAELLLQLSFDPDAPAQIIEAAAPAPPAGDATGEESATPDLGHRAMVAATLPARPVDGDDEALAQRLAAAREAAVRELQVLARELVSSLQFYQGQAGSLPFGEVLVSGGTTRLPGFAAELERLTRVRIRQADPLARVQVDNGIGERDDLASLAVAIGLGVED